MSPDATPQSAPGMSLLRWWQHAGRLALKELREILRDRRTIVTLVLMPILVYPLIGITFQKFLATQLANKPKTEYRLGFRNEAELFAFKELLKKSDDYLAEQAGLELDPERTPEGTEDDPILHLAIPVDSRDDLNLDLLVQDHEIDVGIIFGSLEEGRSRLELILEENSSQSRKVFRYLRDRLQPVNEQFYEKLRASLDPKPRLPVRVSVRKVPSLDQPSSPFSLSTLVPLILILMTVTGAVYPAIDLTAGERERGTMEALISAPIRREEILLAKYVAVLTVALLTAIANLSAMTATAYATGLESLLFGRGGLSLLLILKVFCVLAVFAGFFSSILLAVTSFARSFKEAQAYLIPVMIVSIAPGVLALMPGLRMTWGLSLAPLANMVLLTRDLFEGQLETIPAIIAIFSTVIYAVLGLVFAARIFGTDAVLYGSPGTWSDLWQQPEAQPLAPNVTQVLTCLLMVLVSFVLLGGWLARWVETSIAIWVCGQIVLTMGIFVVLPTLVSAWHRIPFTTTFEIRPTSPFVFLAALIAGLSLWPFAYEAEILTMPAEHLQEMMKKSAGLLARLNAIPFAVRLFVFALLPAVTEELFFRGYLMKGLERSWGAWQAILVSGAIFGAFHIITRDFLSFERFLPTALLGWCLGWVCLRAKSVLPGMLLHTLHNGFLLTVAQYSEVLKSRGIGLEEQRHLPTTWLVIAGALVLCAWVLLLGMTSRRRLLALNKP